MKKKLLTTLVIVATLVINAMPVMAAEYTADGSASCLVTAEIGSTYRVSVPATLDLAYDEDSTKYEGTYQLGAKGNIAGNKKVSVAPASNTLTMTGASTGEEVTASITQEITEFVLENPTAGQTVIGSDDYAYASGEVSVALEQADVYQGNLVFNFSLQDK